MDKLYMGDGFGILTTSKPASAKEVIIYCILNDRANLVMPEAMTLPTLADLLTAATAGD